MSTVGRDSINTLLPPCNAVEGHQSKGNKTSGSFFFAFTRPSNLFFPSPSVFCFFLSLPSELNQRRLIPRQSEIVFDLVSIRETGRHLSVCCVLFKFCSYTSVMVNQE